MSNIFYSMVDVRGNRRRKWAPLLSNSLEQWDHSVLSRPRSKLSTGVFSCAWFIISSSLPPNLMTSWLSWSVIVYVVPFKKPQGKRGSKHSFTRWGSVLYILYLNLISLLDASYTSRHMPHIVILCSILPMNISVKWSFIGWYLYSDL